MARVKKDMPYVQNTTTIIMENTRQYTIPTPESSGINARTIFPAEAEALETPQLSKINHPVITSDHRSRNNNNSLMTNEEHQNLTNITSPSTSRYTPVRNFNTPEENPSNHILKERFTKAFGRLFLKTIDQITTKVLPRVNETPCPICLDPFNPKEHLIATTCEHRFHRKCLKNWIKKKTTCPICRKKLKP